MSVATILTFDLPGTGRAKTKDGEITFSGPKRTMEESDQGPVGFSKKPMQGKLSFKVANEPGVSAKALQALEDINVTVQDDGGKTWLCSGAGVTNEVSLSQGWYSIEMEYLSEEEVK
jgi:hypothetical protein